MIPRGLAVQVLTAVLSDGEALDQALDRISQQHRLEGAQRAWLLDACAGTLRWKGRLDLAVDATALKKRPSGWLRKMLLVGAYQLIVQDRVAPAMVVSETVDEVKKREGEFPAKFANASLRKISEYAQQWRSLPFPEGGTLGEQAAWACLPDWFWRRISEQRGTEWAKAFATASLERPKLWLRMAPGTDTPWDGAVGPVSQSFAPTDGGAIPQRAGFAEGRFFVQDISSQHLVSEVAEKVKSALKIERPSALDLCAAPGGKALGLAWSGFDVVASDADNSRLNLVRENVARLKSGVRVLGREEAAKSGPHDLVWVDAPCTGSGIIRRHPDVKWLRKEKDLRSISGQQEALVREGWQRVKPGGFLVYSVCSVFEEEGPAVLEKCALGGKIEISWLLCPHEPPHGDGFWAVLVQKPTQG